LISRPTYDTGKSRLHKVVVVFKTHFDLGFTGLPDEVMAAYTGPIFDSVRQVMESHVNEQAGPRFSWTLPAWPMKQLLHDPRVPEETRAAARRLVEEGRLHWHAWPFTTHTAFCGLEELVRGLHISRSLSEEFGIWPIAAKQTDVPGHTWIYPSLLVNAGIKFLHLGCNSGSHPPHVPRLFWWEGPDGARLLTYYSVGGYGTPLLPPDDWPFDTWLALQHTLDNAGPQTAEELQRIHATISEAAPDAEIVFGRLDDFASALFEQPEQLESLPVVPYDLADTWIHGIGTMPREVARVRELRTKLLALEQAAVVHDWPGWHGASNANDFPLARKVSPLIDAAYEQLLLFGEHTWGLDVKSTIHRVFGPQFEAARQTEPYKRLESSWAAKAAYVIRAEEQYTRAEHIVRATIAEEPRAVNSANYEVPVPQPIPPPDSTPDNVLETADLRLEVDPTTGGIVSLVDKGTQRDWVDRSSAEPFGGYRYDLYSIGDIAEFMRAYGLYFQDWFVHDFGKQRYPEGSPHVTAYARDFKLEKVQQKDKSHLLLSGGKLRAIGQDASVPEQTISIDIQLGYDTRNPYVDIEYCVEGKQATPLAESTVVPFPINLPKPTFRLGQVGSVVEPGRDIAEGANRSLWCADWLDASDDRVGLGVILIDMPLLSIGNTGIYRFEPCRKPDEPLVYAHLSNTQWGTNFPQWLEGDFRWRVRLIPHQGDWRWGGHLTYHSLRARGVEQHLSKLPFKLFLSSALQLLAIRPRHDGGGVIFRVAESLGHYLVAPSLDLMGPVSALWLCDLMERPVKRLYSQKEHEFAPGWWHVEFELGPYSVGTVLVEFGQGEEVQ
jgi:hypothetical protein